MSFQNQGRGGGPKGGGPAAGPRSTNPGGPANPGANVGAKTAPQPGAIVRYRDDDGILRRSLLDDEAQDAARALGQISHTQIRRFFAQVVAIKRRMEVDFAVRDGEILAQAAFLKASSYYAAARSRDNEPVKDFVVKHVDTIKARQDFLDFHRHFEAVVAFHRYFGKD